MRVRLGGVRGRASSVRRRCPGPRRRARPSADRASAPAAARRDRRHADGADQQRADEGREREFGSVRAHPRAGGRRCARSGPVRRRAHAGARWRRHRRAFGTDRRARARSRHGLTADAARRTGYPIRTMNPSFGPMPRGETGRSAVSSSREPDRGHGWDGLSSVGSAASTRPDASGHWLYQRRDRGANPSGLPGRSRDNPTVPRRASGGSPRSSSSGSCSHGKNPASAISRSGTFTPVTVKSPDDEDDHVVPPRRLRIEEDAVESAGRRSTATQASSRSSRSGPEASSRRSRPRRPAGASRARRCGGSERRDPCRRGPPRARPWSGRARSASRCAPPAHGALAG